MKFDQIDESIDRIVAILAKVPEEFKQRTFDALLTMALAEASSSAPAKTEEKGTTKAAMMAPTRKQPTTISARRKADTISS